LSLVYIYRNRLDNKVYVGKTAFSLKKRHNEHLAMARYRDKNYFHNALRKHGEKNFEHCVVSYASSPEELDRMEAYFIRRYRANEPGHGCNLTFGGDGCVPTEAVRAKLRAARKGKPSPAKGKKWPAESRRRKSESLKGKRPSNMGDFDEEKRRKNISKALKGKAKPVGFGDKVRRSRLGTRLVIVDGKRRFVR
jgi:group I intron endonuclease